MKRFLALILTCFLVLSLFACGKNDEDKANQTQETTGNQEEITQLSATVEETTQDETVTVPESESVKPEEVLLDKIRSASGSEIAHYQYCDFDKDGDEEVFAVLEDEPVVTQVGALWFADSEKTMEIEEYAVAESQIFDCGDKVLFMPLASTTGVGASLNEIWYLNNGTPVRDEKFSASIGCLEMLDDGIIVAHNIAWDSHSEGANDTMYGQTWKRYYFYMSDGRLCEYTGRYIELNELNRYEGAEVFVKAVEEDGWTVTSALVRDCGIVNVNYSKENDDGTTAFENATFKLNGNKLEIVIIEDADESLPEYLRSSYGGIYLPSADE